MRMLFAAASAALTSFLSAQQTHVVLDAPVVVVDGWSRIDELADLDLDGDLDGYGLYLNQVSSSGQPTFMHAKLHRNDGQGRFTSSIVYSIPSSPGQPTQYRSAVGDIDGDGHADLVTLLGGEAWLVESRPGQPSVRTLPWVNGGSFALATGAKLRDVNGDGRAELIVVDTWNGLRVLGLGGTSIQQRCIAVPTVGSTELAMIEANGDGMVDVAVLYGPELRLYPANQFGGITPFASFLIPFGLSSYGNLGHLVAGDIDGDHDVDLVVFGTNGQYCWIERTGPSQFVVRPAAVGGPATDLHDFDGDGDLDGTCCGGGGPLTTAPNHALGNFEIARNLGGGVFAPAWHMPSVGPFHLAGCADIDGDGNRDLVGGRCVYFGRGQHDPVPPVLPPAAATVLADMDRDGDADVLDDAGSLWTNRGNATFSTAALVLPPPPPGATWAPLPGTVDFDGDGDQDLLVQREVGGLPVQTHLLRNAGGGLLRDDGPVTPWGAALAAGEPLFAGDVDGDGDVDVFGTDGAMTARLWLQANGTLTLSTTWPGTRIIGSADFTQDGRADVLMYTYPYTTTTGWMTLKVVSFPASGGATVHVAGDFTTLEEVGIVDHDGDGDLDVVVSEYLTYGYYLRVLANNGLGQLVPGTTFGTASVAPRGRITVADVDGNGLFDFVAGPAGYYDTAPNSGAGVWVVRQLPGQQFDSVLYSCDFGRAIDIEGDGDVDLVGRSILRNMRFAGPSAGEREQFGVALAGTGGGKPTLGAVGPFRVGSTVTTTLTGGMGQGVAVFVASFARAEPPVALVPGFTFYLASPLILGAIPLSGGNQAPGEGSASFALPVLPFVAGLDFYQQAIVSDVAGVAPGVTHTQALRFRIGW